MARTKRVEAPKEPESVSEPINDAIECGICGKMGGPVSECKICFGHAPVQDRSYTLSEHRSGRAPEDDRYGPGGAVGPKIVNLPGSVIH